MDGYVNGESQNAVAKASLLGKTNCKYQQICPLISWTVSRVLLTSQLWAGTHSSTVGLGCPRGSCCADC